MDRAVVPCESASNVESAFASQVASGSVGVFTAADMIRAYEVMDQATYQQLVAMVQAQVRVVDRAVSLQCGSLRLASGSSSNPASDNRSGSAKSGVSGGGSRIASIRRAASWRRKVVPEGLCYTKMFKPSCAESVAQRLGQWPTVASLLKSPASSFKSLDDLKSFRITGDATGVHVLESGCVGSGALSSFAKVAQGLKSSPGTFGAVLRASALEPARGGVLINARTPVGGVTGLSKSDVCDAWASAAACGLDSGYVDLRGVVSVPTSSFDISSAMTGGTVEDGFPDSSLRRNYVSQPVPFSTAGISLTVDMAKLGSTEDLMLLWHASGMSVWDGSAWRFSVRGVVLDSNSKLSFRVRDNYYALWFSFVVGAMGTFAGVSASECDDALSSSPVSFDSGRGLVGYPLTMSRGNRASLGTSGMVSSGDVVACTDYGGRKYVAAVGAASVVLYSELAVRQKAACESDLVERCRWLSLLSLYAGKPDVVQEVGSCSGVEVCESLTGK